MSVHKSRPPALGVSVPRVAHEASPPGALVVWRFADGLRGHENQTDGLIEALAARVELVSYTVSTPRDARLGATLRSLSGSDTRSLPSPDLLVGTGRATHLPLLAARRARGGRAVVLMKPSLPRRWFDLLIVPEHDGLAPGPRVLVTRGALNRIRPERERDQGAGLMLIGGPSRYYDWAGQALVDQIEGIARREAHTRWIAASSRRTPPDCLAALGALGLDNLSCVDFRAMDAVWLPRRLARSAVVWVSEDSVSMVYESLTAGAATGLLAMPRRGSGRGRGRGVTQGIDALLADGLVTTFAAWQAGQALQPPLRRLDEAGRCADWILSEWLTGSA